MYKKHIPYLEVITIHHCQTVLIDPTCTIEFRKIIWLFRHKSAPLMVILSIIPWEGVKNRDVNRRFAENVVLSACRDIYFGRKCIF